MGIGDDAGIGRMGGDEVDGLALDQVKRARISNICPDLRRLILSIQRRIREIQPVSRHHEPDGGGFGGRGRGRKSALTDITCLVNGNRYAAGKRIYL